jgi:hypothetical protein
MLSFDSRAPGRRPVEVALCAAAKIDEKPLHATASRWATLTADWQRQNSNAAFVQVARNQISLSLFKERMT